VASGKTNGNDLHGTVEKEIRKTGRQSQVEIANYQLPVPIEVLLFKEMDAVQKAKQRFKLFPKYLASCASEGSLYAKCVIQTDDPKQNQCEKEFMAFKKCLAEAAKKSGSRI